jgi:hypothetical protein
MIVESFPLNIACRGAVVFEKLVKQLHENNFRLSDHETKIILAFKNVYHDNVFLIFSNTAAPQQVIFQWKLSTVIIFKRGQFNVNMWTL